MKFSYSLLKRVLPKIPPRQNLVDVFGLRVFEIEGAEGDMIDVKLPSNRYSDAASHIGIAREAAAAFRLPFRMPVATIMNAPEDEGMLEVKVEDEKRCPRYSARYFAIKKKIGASPAWMQRILETCGIRPINAIVDVMNYVMLETGQPLHAFDAETIREVKGKRRIIVRNAKKGERFETLDNQKFVLDPSVLVIADEKRALAIAGVKGGKDSGVTARTRAIIVEAANFDQPAVQNTARALKLPTDAAVRFGHGISPALVDIGLDRATELLRAMGAELKDTVHAYPHPAGDEVIAFDPAHFEKLIGEPIARKEAEDYFKRLGFAIEPAKRGKPPRGVLLVRVPAWRNDISIPEDLIEEAARVRGYDTVSPRAPAIAIGSSYEEDVVTLKSRVREFLVNARLDEVYLHSFIPRKDAEASVREDYRGRMLVELENPVSAEFECLRPALRPALLKAVEDNGRYFQDIRMFEIGTVFVSRNKQAEESLHLGIALARKKEHYFYELKGIVSDLFASFGITDLAMVERSDRLYVESDHAALGYLAHHAIGKGWEAAVAELDLGRMLKLVSEERSFRPLPKYPAVTRDISVLVSRNVKIGSIMETIQDAAPRHAADVDLADEYVDEARAPGKQSITFRIVFQAEDRTLTDAEVNAEMAKISAAIIAKFHGEIR